MAIKQPNGNPVWSDRKQSGTSNAIVALALVDDGRGGYGLRALNPGEDPAARLLADARGGFTVNDGADNPGALAELRFIDVGGIGNVSTYE